MNPVSLLFYQSVKSSYREVLVSEREVFCSPDETDCCVDGKYQTIGTPAGQFEVGDILKRVPPEQYPELVVVEADALRRSIPRGLKALKCPKVLILGATHLLENSMSLLMKYAREEGFTVLVSDYNRQHTHFFRRAGFQNVQWLPGLNHCMRPQPIVTPEKKGALFVGQLEEFHPYRNGLFSILEKEGIEFNARMAGPDIAAKLYSYHAVSLNCSVNGELSRGVFDIMGSGGLLLTDRLSENSGLEMLFPDGEACVQYGSSGELVEKARYYIEHEAQALELRRKGYERMRSLHSPETKRTQLLDLVFSGVVDPVYELKESMTHLVSFPASDLNHDLELYEWLQSANARVSTVTVFGSDDIDVAFANDLSRLKRCGLEDVASDIDLSEERLMVVSAEDVLGGRLDEVLSSYVGFDLWVRGGDTRGVDLETRLGEDGFITVTPDGRIYSRSDFKGCAYAWAESFPLAAAGALSRELSYAGNYSDDELIACVQLALELGRVDVGIEFLTMVGQRNRSSVDTLLTLADLNANGGDLGAALIWLLEASRLGELDSDVQEMLDELLASEELLSQPAVKAYFRKIGRYPRESKMESPQRILVYTNLFPPQELGGYGRKMWEFTKELKDRGHEVRVVTGDAGYLLKEASADEMVLEGDTHRRLRFLGSWENGDVQSEKNPEKRLLIMSLNRDLAIEEIDDFKPDLCLMGNLDFIGYHALEEFTKRRIPVIQCLGNEAPGWPKEFRPSLEYYRAGPASQWLCDKMQADGCCLHEPKVLYPGARTDLFYRDVLPDCTVPKISFAGLLMSYKGPQTLMEALHLLKEGGIEFRATFAGDTTDQGFVDALKKSAEAGGFSEWVEFPGFLDREGLAGLFADTNIFVMPSVFEEPFGISQVEAMASGVAVITSGRGGSKEIIRDGQDGLLFDGDDGGDLAQKIASLVADPERWKRLCRQGRERAFYFAIPNTVDKIEEVYLEMLRTAVS